MQLRGKVVYTEGPYLRVGVTRTHTHTQTQEALVNICFGRASEQHVDSWCIYACPR